MHCASGADYQGYLLHSNASSLNQMNGHLYILQKAVWDVH